MLLWLMVLGYAIRFAIFKLPAPPNFSDFNHFYVAALTLRRGSNPYAVRFDSLAHTFGLDIGVNHLSNQPPTFLLCFEPLTRLRPFAAYWAWTGFSLLSLILALGLLLVSETSFNPPQILLFCALMFIYPPTYELFAFANTQNVIPLLIVLAMCCLRRGWNCGAGFSFALATTIKAYPWTLALYLVCERKWRALLWMVIGGAFIGAATMWSLGLGHCLSFFDTWNFTNGRMLLAHPDNLSINAFVSRLFWCREGALPAHRLEIMRVAAVAAVEFTVLVLTIAATAGPESARGWRSLSLWVVAMILLSPTAHGHYLVMLSVPFAAIAEAARQGDATPRVIYAAVASYLLAFSNYPLSILQHYHCLGGTLFDIATEYGFAAAAVAYLAAYWFARTTRETAPHRMTFGLPAAASRLLATDNQ